MPRRAAKAGKKVPVKGKRYPLNMRTTFEVRQQLEVSAAASGRSLAQEAEYRIERAYLDLRLMIEALGREYDPRLAGILFAVAEAMKASGQHAGLVAAQHAGLAAAQALDDSRDWFDNPYAYDQAAQAAIAVIEAMRPEGDPSPPPPPVPLNVVGAIPDFGNLNAQIGKSHAGTVIEEVASGHARNSRGVERARFLHRVNPLAARLRKFCDEEFLNAESHIGDDQ
jgi:predicted component of type VI protein secretion system